MTVIKLRTPRSVHSKFRGCPKSNDRYPYKRKMEADLRRTQGGRPQADRSRDQSDASTSQGLRTASRSWERGVKRILLRVSGRGQPCFHLDFRLLASRTETENISVVCSHPARGHSLHSPRHRDSLIVGMSTYRSSFTDEETGSEKPVTVPVRSVTRRVG